MKVLKERLPVLDEIDKALVEIYKFNQVLSHCIVDLHWSLHQLICLAQDLADFDVTLTQTQEWCDGKAVEKITAIR